MRNDEVYLRRTYDLARLGRSGTKTNPMVGAVLAREGRVLSEGYHQVYGDAHAEIDAMQKADNQDFKGADIYVSLEPCTHYGKTPPCVDLIIKKNFERCIIGFKDINPVVHGKGVTALERAGITVRTDLPTAGAKVLLSQFSIQLKLKRPYIILKWAESRDGFLGRKGVRTKISNPLSDRLVHKWRADSDAIMVGTNTIIIDNPRLDNRLYYGPTPTKIVLDLHGRLPPDAAIFSSLGPVLLFSHDDRYGPSYARDGLTRLDPGENGCSLAHVFSEAYRHNIGTVLVEGGKKILDGCLQEGLWDECRVIKGALNQGDGITAPKLNVLPQEGFDVGGDTIFLYQRETS